MEQQEIQIELLIKSDNYWGIFVAVTLAMAILKDFMDVTNDKTLNESKVDGVKT